MRRLLLVCGALAALVCSTPSDGAQVVVRNTNDGLAGSLRQAINDASPGDTIVFQIPTTSPGYDPNTGIYTIGLTSGELVINKNLTIDPAGQKIWVQRNSGNNRVFNVTGGQVTMLGLTIRNGQPSATTVNGGGILNAANLTVKNCTFTGNNGDLGGSGGAIRNTGTLRVSNCTFSGNQAGVTGTAISNGGNMTLENSTIVGNTAPAPTSDGAAVTGFGAGSATRVRNTIIVGNTRGATPRDVSGTFISEGYNLIGSSVSGTTGFGATGDQIGATPAAVDLFPLADTGGPTWTQRPRPGSVAIDQGNRGVDSNNQPINADQRGYPRPVDLPSIVNAVGGDGSDIGAVETAPQQSGPTFTVTNTAEHSDESCTTDDCTLLEALNAANTNADANTVVFASGLGGVIAVPQPNGFSITTPINIRGPGARQLTIHGGDIAPIFVTSGTGVSFSGLTLNGGRTQSNGGAFSNTGSLTVTDCTITNSRALNTAGGNGNGGGLYNAPGAAATFERCTFFNNRAAGFGGGAIFNSGTITLTNCTFVSNSAPAGGAILSTANNGNSLATLRNCTIAFNVATSTGTANSGGGGYYGEGAVGNTLHHFSNTILAANSNANNPDLRGYGTTEGNNLIGNLGQGGSGFTNGVNGDKVGVSPGLGSFANHGGPTDTESLLSTSPARDAGNDALAPATDQRNFGRSGISDIGAFEFSGVAPVPLAVSSVVSRKVHGASGTFDIAMPLTGPPGVECRTGGANGNYQLVVTFASPVTASGVSIVSIDGQASGTQSANGAVVTVDLTAVANAQTLGVTLTDVSNGDTTADIFVPMGVLVGDTNGSGGVTASDIGQTKAQSGQPVTAANFRADVTANGGSINASDIGLVKSRSGTQLP